MKLSNTVDSASQELGSENNVKAPPGHVSGRAGSGDGHETSNVIPGRNPDSQISTIGPSISD
jgi:hypothetical protein